MPRTRLNVSVDEATAEAARRREVQRGMSVNRYVEELVQRDAGTVGHTFVEAAGDFMEQYGAVFAEEYGPECEGTR
ncbi:antitoxin [Streptomyces sp. NPDC047985]|uniref:antitoxin n=1 Tax=unclassified Streptomyces TaxID=2593676 RepID=UPI003428FF59